jgi:hypothetical protein
MGCAGAIEVFGIASWRPQGQSRRWMGLIVAGIGFEDGSAKKSDENSVRESGESKVDKVCSG